MAFIPKQFELGPIGKPNFPMPLPADANCSAASTGGAAVALTATADANRGQICLGVWWSYSAAPAGGGLTITDGTNTVFQLDITAAGPDRVTFPAPLTIPTNTGFVITLAGGGGAIIGKVNAQIFKQT